MTKIVPILLGLAALTGAGAITLLVAAGSIGLATVPLFALSGGLSVAALAIMGQRQNREQAQLHRSVRHVAKRIQAVSEQLDGISTQIRKNETADAALTATVREVGTSVAELTDTMKGVKTSVDALQTLIDNSTKSTKRTTVELERMAGRLAPGKTGIEETTRKLIARDASALLALHSLVELRAEPLATTSFSATPETLLSLVALVETLPEGAVIVEAGSGLSTVWLALAVAQTGRSIQIVALEHDADYAQATRDAVARQGVDTAVDVRFSPLAPITLNGRTTQWYDRQGWADITRIDILFIDGPPASTGPQSRYPAVPALRPLLADQSVVILDDTDRDDEKDCMESWLAEPDEAGSLTIERELDRATLLRYSRSTEA